MQLKVEICGVNTATLAVLTAEEMDTLLRRVKEGDKAAREKLISGNLRLVLSTIQRFGGRGEPVDDLFQVGCVGLIKAIDNFNVDLGVPRVAGKRRIYAGAPARAYDYGNRGRAWNEKSGGRFCAGRDPRPGVAV